MIQYVLAFFSNNVSTVTDDIMNPSHRYLLEQRMAFIRCPTLVVWGKQDEVLDVSCVDVLKAGISDCQTVVLDGCAHAIYLDRPRCTAQLITEFIQKRLLKSL